MYVVTVLQHGAKTSSGKDPITVDSNELIGLSVVKFVLPVELVSEFDTWLAESLEPRFITRPDEEIAEYTNPEGTWSDIEGIQVVYFVTADADQLEKIEQFASEYSDQR
jgi:hypothetical protein